MPHATRHIDLQPQWQRRDILYASQSVAKLLTKIQCAPGVVINATWTQAQEPSEWPDWHFVWLSSQPAPLPRKFQHNNMLPAYVRPYYERAKLESTIKDDGPKVLMMPQRRCINLPLKLDEFVSRSGATRFPKISKFPKKSKESKN